MYISVGQERVLSDKFGILNAAAAGFETGAILKGICHE
jgi:hypothetical protein